MFSFTLILNPRLARVALDGSLKTSRYLAYALEAKPEAIEK